MELFEQTFRVDSREVDGQGQCRPSALLGFLQEAATGAAERFGFGRGPLLEARGAVWVVIRAMFRLERPLLWGEELTIQTWHRGGRGAILYRDYDLLVNGRPVGEGVSAWVMMHLETGRIEKLTSFSGLERNFGEERCKDVVLTKLRPALEIVPVEVRPMRYSDTDINGHVNNARYADFACDALRLENRERGSFVSRLQVDYLAQCWPGEELELLAAVREGEGFVLGRDDGGKSRFAAQLTLDKLPLSEIE